MPTKKQIKRKASVKKTLKSLPFNRLSYLQQRKHALKVLKDVVEIINSSSDSLTSSNFCSIISAIRGPDIDTVGWVKSFTTNQIRWLIGLRDGSRVDISECSTDYFKDILTGLDVETFISHKIKEAYHNYYNKDPKVVLSPHFNNHIAAAVTALASLGLIEKK